MGASGLLVGEHREEVILAAEWFVPLATGVRERPRLFGQPFEGPKGPWRATIRSCRGARIATISTSGCGQDNPAGLFATTNPRVTCEHADYRMERRHPPHVHPR